MADRLITHSLSLNLNTIHKCDAVKSSGNIELDGRNPNYPQHMTEFEDLRERIAHLIALANKSFHEGDYPTARAHYERLRQVAGDEEMEYTLERIECLANLSAIYYAEGDLVKARRLYSRVVLATVRELGENHRDVISHMLMLAKVCDEMHDVEDAAGIFARVVNLADKFLKPNDPLCDRVHKAYSNSSASVNSLRQTLALKKLDLTDGEVVTATEKKGKTKVVKHDVYAISTISSVTLILAAAAWMYVLFSGNQSQPVSPATQAAADQSYVSLDDSLQISFKNHQGIARLGDQEFKFPIHEISAAPTSIPLVLEGMLAKNEVWIVRTENGLILDNGAFLYSESSPDWQSVKKIKEMAVAAGKCFEKEKTYPARKEDWEKYHDLSWFNPFTSKAGMPVLQVSSQYTGNDILFSGMTTNEQIATFLRAGGQWFKEANPEPGAIHALAVYSPKKIGERFVADRLYLHGFGRDNQVLRGATQDSHYFVALSENGDFTDSDTKTNFADLVKSLPRAAVYVTAGEQYLLGLFHFRYLAHMIWGSGILILIGLWLLIDARKRNEKKTRLPTLLELLIAGSLLIWIGTLLVRAFSANLK